MRDRRIKTAKAWFGWPDLPQVESEISSWFEASRPQEEKAAAARINQTALEGVVFAPTGFFLTHQAWRKNVTGIAKGPLPFFWGISKSV